ncbi:MAG: M23 family metallopeptidase [Ramlibacter sp.]
MGRKAAVLAAASIIWGLAHGAGNRALDDLSFAGENDRDTPLVLLASGEPIPFRGSDARIHLDYELIVTNARKAAVRIKSVEVLNEATGEVVSTISGPQLKAVFTLINRDIAEHLEPAQSGIFWLDVSWPEGATLPRVLTHRVTTEMVEARPANPQAPAKAEVQTAARLRVSSQRALVVGPPLEGTGWVALNSCCDGGHRQAGFPVNGQYFVAQRFAIDWMKLDDERHMFKGSATVNRDYPTYGQNAIAVADGRVASVLDGLPERVSGALPGDTTLQNASGNHVIIDLGSGRFAFYAHLQPGSIQVRKGDSVKRGQVLAKAGNSGNTSAPHLHFHITQGPGPLSAQGLPYVIDRFDVRGLTGDANDRGQVEIRPAPGPRARRAELPMDNTMVDFPAR